MYLRQLETMPLPPQLQAKYLARFDELVQRGHTIHASITTKQTPSLSSEVVDTEALRQWETSRPRRRSTHHLETGHFTLSRVARS